MADLIKGFKYHTITKDGVITNTKTGKIKSQWTGKNGYKYVDIIEDGKTTKIAVHRILALQYIPNPFNKRTVNHIDGNKQNNTLSNLEWATDSENVKHAYTNNLQPYRRNLSKEQYLELLHQFLYDHKSLTELSKEVNNSLTQLSFHLRESAIDNNLLEKYEQELKAQKLKRAKQAGLSKRNKITLLMLDKETNKVLNTFNSITEAKEFLQKKSCGPISNVLAKRQKTAYGYKWKTV